jgi:predicted RNA-binding protein YlxR (DUF448 family)
VADETGKLSGRGAYVCANEKCIGLAAKQKRFERALAVSSGIITPELFETLYRLAPKDGAQAGIGDVETNPTADMLIES